MTPLNNATFVIYLLLHYEDREWQVTRLDSDTYSITLQEVNICFSREQTEDGLLFESGTVALSKSGLKSWECANIEEVQVNFNVVFDWKQSIF